MDYIIKLLLAATIHGLRDGAVQDVDGRVTDAVAVVTAVDVEGFQLQTLEQVFQKVGTRSRELRETGLFFTED